MTSGSAPQPDKPADTQRKPTRRARGYAVVTASLVAMALTTLAWWRLPPYSPGEGAVASTDFAAGTWQDRWVCGQAGSFVQTPGGLRTLSPGSSTLIFRTRLAAPVAVDYQAEMETGAFPGDLSLIWSEREGVDREPWNLQEGSRRVILVQHAAFENTHSTLRDDGGLVVLARDNRRLQSGRTYSMRVELRRDAITASIDGEVVLHSELAVPLTSGYVALYGHFPGKLFRSARITRLGPASEPPLSVGDALLRTGHYDDAAEAYGAAAELHPGTPVAELACYRKGYAEHLAGSRQQARRAWAALRDPELLARAEILQLDDLVATGSRDRAYARFAELWPGAGPANRRVLVQRWQAWIRAAIADPAFGDEQLRTLLAVRSRHFPDDAVSGEATAAALLTMRRYDAVLSGFASYSQQRYMALLALGRGDEVLAGDWALSWQRAHTRFVTGDMEAVVKDPYSAPVQVAMALCKLDRAHEAIPLTPDRHPGLLHAGRAQELLADARLPPDCIGQALIALGRGGELLDTASAEMRAGASYGTALRLAGRIDDAERQHGGPLPGLRLIAALEGGSREAVADALGALRRTHQPLIHTGIGADNWFSFAVVDAYAAWILDGDARRAAGLLREKGDLLRHDVARRPTLVGAVIAGDADPGSLAGLPFRSEADAWTAVATALRSELAGDLTTAAAAYARFSALPMHRRLLADNLPNAEVERFVAWRQRRLAATRAPVTPP